MDPDFHTHRAIAQVMAHSVLALADDQILPMNATKYAEKLRFGVKALTEKHGDVLTNYNITIGKGTQIRKIHEIYIERGVD